jgi:magnesium-protoporphyrin O-methyltransferase
MTCSQCVGIECFFDDRTARRQLRRYRKKGPAKDTRRLLEALADQGVDGATFLDVGGGVGAIQHELMAAGASRGTNVDASPAYLAAAQSEAQARGYASRMRYVKGDLVDTQAQLEPADLVTLDRVVCCYPDMAALVDASASRARRAYGLVYPRDTRLMKLVMGVLNAVQRLRRHPFRGFVHPTAAVEARVAAHGFSKAFHSQSLLWQVVVFTRT